MATHSSILAWRIPQTEEPSGLQSMGLKELSTTEYLTHTTLVSLSPFSAESPWVYPSDMPNFYSYPPSILWWFCSFKSRACLLPSHCSVASDCIALSRMLLFSHSVMSHSLRPHRLQHARLPSPSLSPGVCSNSCPLSQ